MSRKAFSVVSVLVIATFVPLGIGTMASASCTSPAPDLIPTSISIVPTYNGPGTGDDYNVFNYEIYNQGEVGCSSQLVQQRVGQDYAVQLKMWYSGNIPSIPNYDSANDISWADGEMQTDLGWAFAHTPTSQWKGETYSDNFVFPMWMGAFVIPWDHFMVCADSDPTGLIGDDLIDEFVGTGQNGEANNCRTQASGSLTFSNGQQRSYTGSLFNPSGSTLTVDLSDDAPSGWSVSYTGGTSVEVGAGGWATYDITISAPGSISDYPVITIGEDWPSAVISEGLVVTTSSP